MGVQTGPLPLVSHCDSCFWIKARGSSVHYDSNEDAAQTIVVSKQGSGEWRELCVSLNAPRFSGSDGGDVWLTNDDTDDDIWDSLEISTASSEEIALKGCDWQN